MKYGGWMKYIIVLHYEPDTSNLGFDFCLSKANIKLIKTIKEIK